MPASPSAPNVFDIMDVLRRIRAMARGWAACVWMSAQGLLMAAAPTAADFGLADQSVDVWETAQGLPQNTVTAITQTRDGYLWLGTEAGLACFDGSRFQVFSSLGSGEFPSNRITALCADRQGGLWIGTADGGASYLFRGEFRSFTTREGLADNRVLSLGLGADQVVWIGTSRGVSVWRNGTLERPVAKSGLLSGPVTAIGNADGGEAWMLGPAGVFAATDTGEVRLPAALSSVTSIDGWQGLVPGQSGNLWLFGNSLVRLSMDGRSAAEQALKLTPGDRITAVCERGDGEVWVGTRSGRLRRLGNHGKAPMEPAAGPAIRCFFEDRELNLWLGLEGGGLVRVKPKRVQIFGVRDGLPGEHITGMCSDGKRGLWVGCHAAGIAHWREGEFAPFTANGALPRSCVIWSLLRSQDGGLWIGTEGAGLLHWKDERLEAFGAEQGMTQSSVRCLLETNDGSLWIGGRDGGIIRRDATGFVRLGMAEGFDGQNLTALADDRNGGLWIGTEGQGLYHFSGGKFTRHTRADGLGADHVRALLADQSEVLWIGTSGGLTRLKDGVFRNIGSRDGLWDEVISQIVDPDVEKQMLWLGSNHGVFRIHKASIEDMFQGRITTLESVVYGRAEGMDCLECSSGFSPSGLFQSAVENPGTNASLVWFPTLRGLARLDKLRLLGEMPGITGDHITFARACLHLGAEGTRFDLGDVVAGGDGFGKGRAAGINLMNGSLVQDAGSGAFRDPATDARARYHRSAVAYVDGVFIPDGGKDPGRRVVISSTGLTAEFPATSGEAYGPLKSGYRPAERDVFNPTEMAQLGPPMVWLSGNQGVTFDLEAIRKATGKTVERFTAHAGNLHIGSASFHVLLDGHVAERRSGVVYDNESFERGIVPLDIPVPPEVRFLTLAATDDKDEIGVLNRVPPPVIIEEVRADGALVSPDGNGGQAMSSGALHPEFASVVIPPGKGRLDVRYAAPSLAAPEKVRFRHRLEPLEKSWVEAGDRRSANYANLAPGAYRFVVTACNNDGVWNEHGVMVALTIKPHFWQTAWFTPLWISVLAGIIACVTGLAIRVRHRRQIRHLEHLHAVAAERTRIARDLHDDLGAGLTQMALLSDMVRSVSEEPHRAQAQLNQVSTVSKRLARSLDEIVWAINPKNDALEDSLAFVCKFAQDFLRTAGLACRLDWPEELAVGHLSSARRHHLYLAVREALNNVVKHADATEVRLRLAASGSDLVVEIRDNGRGFVVPENGVKSARHGLQGMTERMRAVGGDVGITSESGQGTTVRMRLPMTNDQVRA